MKTSKVRQIQTEALAKLQLSCDEYHAHGVRCMEGPEEAKQIFALCNEILALRQKVKDETERWERD